MCGLFGGTGAFASKLSTYDEDTLRHRGPDVYKTRHVEADELILGHHRLSILDLSDNGSQPMQSKCKRYYIVYNGECYNYKILKHKYKIETTSGSDTEIILELFAQIGASVLNELDGMFALVIYDSFEKTMILARDTYGQKPLYYSVRDNSICFSSELRLFYSDLLKFKRLDKNSLKEYLTYGVVSAPHTLISDVKKIAPGHVINFNLISGELQISALKHIQKSRPIQDALESTEENLEKALCEAVRMQLEADVEVGVLLSGGLDSSLVCSIASEVSEQKVTAFTASFTSDRTYNEVEYATKIALHCDVEHKILNIDSDIDEVIDNLLDQFDEPISDSSLIPTYLLTQEIAKHCKVAIGGDGADEFFGGYKSYRMAVKIYFLRKLIPSYFRRLIYRYIKQRDFKIPGQNYIKTLFADDHSLVHWGVFFQHSTVEKMTAFSGEIRKSTWRLPKNTKKTAVENIMNLDQNSYLPDDILVKTDRSSMLNSLELRAPFLSNSVSNIGLSLDVVHKLNSRSGKLILQRIAKKRLPADYDTNRKQGFKIPLQKWYTKNQQKVKSEIVNSSLFHRNFFNEKFFKRRDLNTERIFLLYFLSRWVRVHGLYL